MDEIPRAAPKEKLVLLVDDEESLLDLMEHVVKHEGFRTDRAEDGPEALRKAQHAGGDRVEVHGPKTKRDRILIG